MRARLDALLGDPAVVAVGECGLDYYRDRASRAAQAAAFAGQVELAERHGKPLVIHTREAADDTLAVLRDDALRRRPALLLAARAPRRGGRARLVRLVRGQRHLPLGGGARRRRARACRPSCCCSRPTARTSRRVPHRGKPNRPRYVLETLRAVAAMRGVDAGELAAQVEANAARVFALP